MLKGRRGGARRVSVDGMGSLQIWEVKSDGWERLWN